MTGKRQKKNNWIEKLRRGFTITELLAVVAIIGILAAFGFVNVYQHQKNLHQTELDDTAREIFTAAQNHLTIANASGKWKKILNDNSNLGQAMTSMPSDAKDIDDNDWSDPEKHNFHFFEVGNSNTDKVQNAILPSNSIDGTIVPTDINSTHQIIIEYDAKTATIYAVWYTDGKSGWFGQAQQNDRLLDNGEERDEVFSKGRDDKSVRSNHKPQQVGYYGGGTRTQAKDYKDDELTVPNAEIVNTDKLYVKVPFSPDKDNFDQVSANSNTTGVAAYIDVKGNTSGNNSGKMDFSQGNLFYLDSEGYEVGREAAAYVCYTLDSTTNGSEGHFAIKFDAAHTPSHRALIPGENITVTVTKTKGKDSRSRKLPTTNSLFANIESVGNDASSTNKQYTAYIKYGRHLQNLSSAASKLNKTGQDKILITNASIQNDLDWGKFYLTEGIELDRSNANYPIGLSKYNPNSQSAGSTGSSALYSIVNNDLTAIEGNSHKIKNLQVQQEIGGNTVGLIGQNTGVGHNLKIRNLTLKNPYLRSDMSAEVTGQNTGFFIGEASNQVNLFNCKVELSQLDGNANIVDQSDSAKDKNNISSQDNISMFVGKAMAGSNLTIRKAAVTVDPSRDITMTSSSLNTGLLIGQAQENTVNVTDATIDLKGDLSLTATEGNAGGLIGNDSGTTNIEQVSITNAENKKLNITANGESTTDSMGNAAILVGRAAAGSDSNKNITIKNVDLSLNGPTAVATAVENAGGIIGNSTIETAIENVTISSSDVFRIHSDNPSDGNSKGHVGGVIGQFKSNDKNLTLNQVQINLTGEDSTQESDKSGITTNHGNAGGLIGTISGSNEAGQTSIQNCQLSVEKNFEINGGRDGDDNNNGNAGGLIGRASDVKPDIENVSVKVIDAAETTANERDTKGITISATTNAGGIIGSISTVAAGNNRIENVQYDGGNYGVVKAEKRSAGGFIGRIDSNGLTVTDSTSSTYVYMHGTSDQYVGRAGGFIGYIQQDSGNTSVEQCYYGGRTDHNKYERTYGYGTDLGYDGSKITLGGYNIVNENVKNIAGDDTASSGGFIGTTQADSGTIQISNSYTTGSAYVSNGTVGGFIGKVSDKDNNSGASLLTLTNTYTTGLVKCEGSKDGGTGTFIGRYSQNGNLTGSSNYYLKGINGNSAYAIGADIGTHDYSKKKDIPEDSGNIIKAASATDQGSPFQVAKAEQQSTSTYDETLRGESYPYKTVQQLSGASPLNSHVGDWPVVTTNQSFDHDFAVLYYEKVQHGYDKTKTEWYYHGYCADAVKGGSVDYQEIKTTNTLKSSGELSSRGLLTAKNGNEYVAEDGYIILVADKYTSDLDKVAVSNEWQRITLREAISQGLLCSYDDVLAEDKLNITGYKAYFLNPDNSLYSQWNENAPFTFYTETQDTATSTWNWNTFAKFHYLPVFADCIAPKLEDLPSKNIRSASQLHWLFDRNLGDKYIGTDKGGHDVVTQTMDIDFSSEDVNFSFMGNPVSYNITPYFNAAISGTYQGEKKGKNYYSLKNLNHTLIQTIQNNPQGKLKNLVIENYNAAGGLVDNNTGLIQNITVRNGKITGKENNELTATLINGDNSGEILNCNLSDIDVVGSGLVGGNNSGNISACTLSNANSITKSAIVNGNNSGTIEECRLFSGNVYENGIVGGESSGNISNCSIEDATIKGNGIANKISGSKENKGDILNEVHISGNGFADSISGNVISCHVISSTIAKNGFAMTLDNGSQMNSDTLERVAIVQNGFAENITGNTTSCKITDAEIGKNGFAATFGSGTATDDVLTNAIIGENGFADTSSGNYSLCKIINAQIGKNGFVKTFNGGTADRCQIYTDSSKYTGDLKYFKLDSDEKGLYDYVQIGKEASEQEDISGFVGSMSNGTIQDCSVTGNISSSRNATGFVYTADGGTIKNNYANTVINTAGNAAGFAYSVNNWPTLANNHALGILKAQNAAGFAFNMATGTIRNSYSAIWQVELSNSGQYISFLNKVGSQWPAISNCYYLKNGAPASENINGVIGVSAAELKGKKDTLGSSTATTVPYYQYMSKENNTTYPFPISSMITNYGDWQDSDNASVLNQSHAVQFFDEDGSALTDELQVNDGASVVDQVPESNVPEGKDFAGWYDNNQDFSDSHKISEDTFKNVKKDIKAYAHYVTKNNYVELHYVDPTSNSTGSLDVVKIENGTVREPENIRNFGGYTRDNSWYTSADGSGTPYSVSNGAIQNVPDGVRDLYLLYHKTVMHNITLEIRADNDAKTYPLIYQSYVREYAENTQYDITQSLKDFEQYISDNNNLNYTLEKNGLRKRNLNVKGAVQLDSVNEDEASLNESDKTVKLSGTADSDKTYVVLYKGSTVTYQIRHVFKNSIGINNNDKEADMPANTSNKLAYANSLMKYSANADDTFTVIETRQGSLGEYIDLEKEVYTTGDNSDSGYKATLPNSNFVLNEKNQQFTINYSRKEYLLTIDTNGAEVADKSPVKVPFGDDISANSTYLKGLPAKVRTGYTLDQNSKWSYKETRSGTPVNNGEKMPAANTTATANWLENTKASYTVEVWTQKVDTSQHPGMPDADKTYDYYDSFTVAADDQTYNPGVGNSPDFLTNENQTNTLVNDKLSTASKDLKYFSVNVINAENRKDNDENNGTNSGILKIRADGKTVYRVFYDRKTITFNFDYNPRLYLRKTSYNGRDYYRFTPFSEMCNVIYNESDLQIKGENLYFRNKSKVSYFYYGIDKEQSIRDESGRMISAWVRTMDSNPELTSISGLYGQEISDSKVGEAFEKYLWGFLTTDTSTNPVSYGAPTQNSLVDYIPPEGIAIGDGNNIVVTFRCCGKNPTNNLITVRHYQEGVDGQWMLKDTTSTNATRNITLNDKYNGYQAYGSAWGDYGEIINPNQPGLTINRETKFDKPSDNDNILDLFYTRKYYVITLTNVKSMSNVQTSLGDIGKDGDISVKYKQPLKDIGLPTDNNVMEQHIPESVDQNGVTKGYTFGGWYTSPTFSQGTEVKSTDTMPNHNIRLYAKWIAPEYTVTYMDGTTKIRTETVEKYGTISLKDAASVAKAYPKPGSTFVGWYTDNREYLASRPVTTNLVLHAKYEKETGTAFTYTVRYVYEDGTQAAEPKTVSTEIGKAYEERPLDIANAVSLDVRSSGYVTENMEDITFHYRKYQGSNWNYTVRDKVAYTDLDNSENSVEATIKTVLQSTTNTTKSVNGENIHGYLLQEPTSKTVAKDDKSKEVEFTYKPDYWALKADNLSAIYGEAKEPTFSGMSDWAVPDGWKFETKAEYKNSSGEKIDRPKNAGDYTVELSLYLTNNGQSIRLYTRNEPYRIMKKTIILTSADGTWTYNGETHSNPKLSEQPQWVEGEGATYDFSGSSIREKGSITNAFTVKLNDGTDEKNYNIYRKFGTLTVNG